MRRNRKTESKKFFKETLTTFPLLLMGKDMGEVRRTQLIEDLELLIKLLGEAQILLGSGSNKLVKEIRHILWEAIMKVSELRLLCLTTESSNEEQQCLDFLQLSQMGVDEEIIAYFDEISDNPATSKKVAEAAKEASQKAISIMASTKHAREYELENLKEIEAAQRAIESRIKQDLADEIEKRVGERLEELLHGPRLDNYNGYVYAQFTDESEDPLEKNGEGIPCASTGQAIELKVWLQTEPLEGIFSEKISIDDGQENPNQVIFDVELDTDDLEFTPHRGTFLLQPNQDSSPLVFSSVTPKEPRICQVWVYVSQKNRMIQVVKTGIQIKE